MNNNNTNRGTNKRHRSKKDTNTPKDQPNFELFSKNMAHSVLVYICFGVVLIGTTGLYLCKIAQSNVLPDDLKEIPFNPILTNVEQIGIESNITKEYDWKGLGWLFFRQPLKEMSQTIHFDNKQVLNTYFTGMYGKLYEHKFKNNIALYFLHIFDTMFSTNNMITNKVFQFMNSALPEWVILLIFPIIAHIMLIFMAIVNLGSSIVAHVWNVKDLFLMKDKTDPTKWEDYNETKFFKLWPLIKFIAFAFVSIWSVIIITIISTVSWIATPLYVSFYRSDDSSKQHPLGLFDFIKDIVLHKHQLILALLSVFTLYNSSTYLTSSYTLGIFVAILLSMYYGVFCQKAPEQNNTFHTTPQPYSTKQAKKTPGNKFSEETMMNILNKK